MKSEVVGWMDKERVCIKKNAVISYLVDYRKEFHSEMYNKFFDFDYNRNGMDVRENQ